MNEEEKLWVDLIMQAILKKYGYDFTQYNRTSIRRRLLHRMEKEGLENFSQLLYQVIHSADYFQKILQDFSVQVTEFFRDPEFFQALRNEVFPLLASKRQIKIWVAGCATGEEAFSIAILLRELGMYENSYIYATDLNHEILNQARGGIVSRKNLANFSKAYLEAGGEFTLSKYLQFSGDLVKVHSDLLENIVFSDHNLVQDRVFGEMDLIICRNVLIYFNQDLQKKVIQLFVESLSSQAFLALGMKEGLYFKDHSFPFKEFDPQHRIYQLNK